MTEINANDVTQTLAEYERLAIDSGKWQGTTIEFSNDGKTWEPYVFPTDEHPHPQLARATVHREGVTVPTTVVIAWDESIPKEDDWIALWTKKPHVLFGAAAARAAFRRAFRDVIADRLEPGAPNATAPAPRDWHAEVGAAQTEEEVKAIHAAARQAKAVDLNLDRALRQRLREIEGAAGGPPRPTTPILHAAEALQAGVAAINKAAVSAGPRPTPPKAPLTTEPVKRSRPRRSRDYPASKSKKAVDAE